MRKRRAFAGIFAPNFKSVGVTQLRWAR